MSCSSHKSQCHSQCHCSKCQKKNSAVKQLANFSKWRLTDYSQAGGFADGVRFEEKEPIYSSELAFNGSIFNPGNWSPNYESLYHLRNFDRVFPPGSSVPGPYDYNKGINLWGNDKVYEMGIYKYSIIISTFGNSRIHNAMIVNEMKSVGASSPSSESIVNRLPGESIRIFQWYAKLIDDNGRDTVYDSSTPKGALLDLFKQLITSIEPIDPKEIIGAFCKFNNLFFKSDVKLTAIIRMFEEFLHKILRKGEIPFLPWRTISNMHAKYSTQLYDFYRDFYDALYLDREHIYMTKEILDRHSIIFADLSNQFAAFFSAFYTAVAFLDTALNVSGDMTQPAIPPEYLFERINAVNSYLNRYWVEHMSFFRDYNMLLARKAVMIKGNKAGNLNNEIDKLDEYLYRAKITIVESCDSLAMTLSVIFRDFNWINDMRHVLSKLPPYFPK